VERLYKRTLVIVVIAQLFGGAGLAAGVTVGALLARDMLGSDSYAGLPAALLTLGSAASAYLLGGLMQRHGRRPGLAAGFLIGGIGAVGVVLAAVTGHIALLFVSLLLYGAGTASNLQARYAGTDLAKPGQRATAVSMAMVSTTFGAVAGPNLVEPMGRFAVSLGIPALAGPFLLGAAAFLLAGLFIAVFLRPDPLIAARTMTEPGASGGSRKGDGGGASVPGNGPAAAGGDRRGLFIGIAVMVLTQIVMVAVMTMTPVHMEHHGHGLAEVGLVIGIHIGAMYLPSLVTGLLIDRIGRMAMSVAAGAILLAASLLAAVSPADSLPLLIAALALLGLGWNLGLISGTALIVDATTPSTRAGTQGKVDVLVALSGAGGGALSGTIVAHSSYAALAAGGAVLSLLLVPVVFGSRSRRGRAVATAADDRQAQPQSQAHDA